MLVNFSLTFAWLWLRIDAQLQWTKIGNGVGGDPNNWPAARKDFAIGYDSERRFITVFGGIGIKNEVLGDTWVLDLFLSELINIEKVQITTAILFVRAMVQCQSNWTFT